CYPVFPGQRIGFSENNLTVKFAPEKLDNKAFLFDPYHNCVWLGSRSGLLRIDLTEPRVSGTDSAFVYPNPLTRNDHALVFKKIPPDAKIYIFSIDGRLIKKLEDFDPTVSGYIWFDAEINLTSGLYFALIKSPQEKRILKFAVVK
ncbi:MAG: T9SS type A sorting domain-containing protein, partial [candidate division WOR-3 bacterium]